MGLKEVLIEVVTAAGLSSGEQNPITLEEVLQQRRSGEISQSIVTEAAQQDPSQKFRIQWGLEQAASEMRDVEREINTAKEISDLLPQVEELLKNWDSEEAPGHGLEDHKNPIHQLQEALGMRSHDGEWGKDTLTALIEYEKDGIQNGFAGGHTIDTRQFPEINDDTYSLASEARADREEIRTFVTQQKALEKQIADQAETHNKFISGEFERCTGEAIDLSQENLFADILQEIGPRAQIADEQQVAHERVADAIKTACGRYLDQIQGDDVKAGLIERLAAGLEPAVNEAVTKAADAAYEEALNGARAQGHRNGYTAAQVDAGFSKTGPS